MRERNFKKKFGKGRLVADPFKKKIGRASENTHKSNHFTYVNDFMSGNCKDVCCGESNSRIHLLDEQDASLYYYVDSDYCRVSSEQDSLYEDLEPNSNLLVGEASSALKYIGRHL